MSTPNKQAPVVQEAPVPAARAGPVRPSAAAICDLAGIFLRLGTVAFGGPAAHIAMMRAEFVARRGWLTEQEFLDLIGAANLIPGPSSTEVAIHVGLRRMGWIGLVLAGTCFILPAALIVTAIAWGYSRYGHLPQAAGILYGIKPVIIAVVAQALWMLGRTALKSRALVVLALAATAAALAGISPLWLIFGGGYLIALARWASRREGTKPLAARLLVTAALVGLPLVLSLFQPGAHAAPSPPGIFAVFLRIGSVVYGSGYVLLAFLRTALVDRQHWITTAQLLDATAVGQFTPGPVFTTATFIGYILRGPLGALAATAGIFLPGFVLVGISGPFVPKLRTIPTIAGFLDGVNAASLALMAAVTYQLARAAIIDLPTSIIALVGAVLLIRFKINSAWLVLAGAAVGWALAAIR